jgi:hypothetical protein
VTRYFAINTTRGEAIPIKPYTDDNNDQSEARRNQ